MKPAPREGGGRPEKIYYAPNGQKFSSLIAVKQYLAMGGALERPPAKRARLESQSALVMRSSPTLTPQWPPAAPPAAPTPNSGPARVPREPLDDASVSPMLGGLGGLGALAALAGACSAALHTGPASESGGALTDHSGEGAATTGAAASSARPRSDSQLSVETTGTTGSGRSPNGDRERVCPQCKPKHRTLRQL